MCPFKILLFALSLSRYHYLKSLWRGPCCWHSCGLGVNAQDVPHCCQPARQLHKNTQPGKMISRMCGDSLRNVFLTGALENVYVMGWDHNLDKSFYLICSLRIQLVNLYLVGLCFHWKSVFFCQVATTVACKNLKLYFPGWYLPVPEGGSCAASLTRTLLLSQRAEHTHQIFSTKPSIWNNTWQRQPKSAPLTTTEERCRRDPLLCSSAVLYRYCSVGDREALPCRHERRGEDNVVQRLIFV